MKKYLISIASSLLVFACQYSVQEDKINIPSPNSLPKISDAVHSDGNDHFYFLPPLVPATTPSGVFDNTLSPEVKICALDADEAVCIQDIATYTTTTGPGSETVRVDQLKELYIVNWHTDEFDLSPDVAYRIIIMAGGMELGFADVVVVSNSKELKNIDNDESIPLKDGRTLPIKFRIEEGALVPPIPDGLIAYWNFNEDGGADIIDQTGNGHNGTVVGSVSRTPGMEGSALVFDGSSHVIFPVLTSFQLQSATYSIWLKPSTTADVPVFEYAQSGSRAGWHTWINTHGYTTHPIGAVQVNLGMYGSSWQYYYTQNNLVSQNNWHHLAVTFDDAANISRIYVDGVEVAQKSVPGAFIPVQHSSMYLGWRPDYSPEWGAGKTYAGQMDEIMVFNRALTPEEIEQVCGCGAP